jgi:hypothetical protein
MISRNFFVSVACYSNVSLFCFTGNTWLVRMATSAVFPSSFIIFLVSESIYLSLLRICVAWAATFSDMPCISALTSKPNFSNLPWSYVCVPPHSSHLNQPCAKVQLCPNHSAIQPTMTSFFQSVFVSNKTRFETNLVEKSLHVT